MAGGVAAPAVCCALLLLLPPPADASRCLQLRSVSAEHGSQRSDVRVSAACGCREVALFVKLNGSGMPVDCAQNGSWHDAKQTAAVVEGVASFHTVVAGCFQARCICVDDTDCRQHWDFDGLDYHGYNLVISAVQLAGLPPRLDVHAWPYGNATQFFFQQLEVRLYRCQRGAVDAGCRHYNAARLVANVTAPSADLRVKLAGTPDPLTPGRYRLEVLPHGSWVCQGSNNGCKRIELFVSVSASPAVSGAVLPPVSDDRMKALYAVIGVTLAVIAAGLVFLWRECSAVRPGRGALFADKAPAPSGAHVLLVHLWSGQRLSKLKTELRGAGLQVSDIQERGVSSLLRAMPVADVLTSDQLRHAKIVFLFSERALELERRPAGSCDSGGGGFSSTSTALSGQEALFSAVLHCIRNSSLAQDYQRVFVVLPEGGSCEDEAGPAALVPGCRFRWPVDGAELVRQLNTVPAEVGCERVV